MLPKNLTSTYRQYKDDTDTIASWLAATAKKWGFSSSSDATALSKSLKKRNKAKQKVQEQNASKETTVKVTQGRPTYTIAIKDFTILAEYIVGLTNPVVQVPESLTIALNRVIRIRQLYSGAISEHLPNGVKCARAKASDDRHSFFVGVLEDVRGILRPRMVPEGCDVNEQVGEVRNRFETLEVEEPSAAFEAAPSINPTMPAVPETDADYEAEQLQGLEEDFLAFYLLLKDLTSLRTEVSRTWQAYKQGIIELTAASISTNTAVDLARSMEEDLQSLFTKHGGTEQMLPMFFYGQCEMAGTAESYRELPGDEINFKMYQTADACFWPAYLLLDSFKDMVDPKHFLEYKPGFFGQYNPSSDRSRKSRREQFREDKIILLEALPEFVVICRGTEHFAAEDELTRGLRIMFKTKQLPLWLVFAATIFVDIHRVLRQDAQRGFADLHSASNQISASIKQNFKFHENLKVDTWPPQNDMMMRHLQDEIKSWVFEDAWHETKKLNKLPCLVEPFYLMRNHPWSCGLWKFHFQTAFHEMSIIFAGAWGSILYTAHLYHAVRSEKLLDARWKDMDIVFAMQGIDNFFTGDPPNNPDDYLRRFCMAMGYSATAFAQNKRKSKVTRLEASKRGPISLKELAPVSNMFKARFTDDGPRTNLTSQDVEKILAKSEWEEEEDEFGDRTTEKKEVFAISKHSEGKKKSRVDYSKLKLTPARLLTTLRNSLHAEAMELSFDYLMFHRNCWRLLREVKEKCRDRLIKMYGPQYIERENQLPFVVGYVFGAAADTKKIADVLKEKKTDEITSALLVEASRAVEVLIESGAGEIVTKVVKKVYGIETEVEDDDE